MTTNFDRQTPSGAVAFFRHCIHTGDLPGALSCFDPKGVYLDRDGQTIAGLENIEKPMQHLCSWRPSITGVKRQVIVVGDLVMWMDKWVLKGQQPDGHLIEMEGATTCVMKRNEAGNWVWLVDNPFAATFFED